MAHWRKAFCHGPNINNPVMDVPGSVAAWKVWQQALALANKSTPVEVSDSPERANAVVSRAEAND